MITTVYLNGKFPERKKYSYFSRCYRHTESFSVHLAFCSNYNTKPFAKYIRAVSVDERITLSFVELRLNLFDGVTESARGSGEILNITRSEMAFLRFERFRVGNGRLSTVSDSLLLFTVTFLYVGEAEGSMVRPKSPVKGSVTYKSLPFTFFAIPMKDCETPGE